MSAEAATASNSSARLEAGAGFEFVIAIVDLRAGQGPESVHAELLAAETAQDRAVDDGTPQIGDIDLVILRLDTLTGKIADEAARETIACAGRIEHLFQQIPWRHEVTIAA